MKNPIVSVIISSYDHPHFLRTRSIPSVLSQTYPYWELIVVGDGPVDGSLRQTVNDFNDPRIKYVEIPRPDYSKFSKEQFWHLAGAAARNYGLSLARGEIIAPLDDDDEFYENHLQDCVKILENGAFDFVYGNVLVRDIETGKEYEDLFSWSDPKNRELFEQRNIMFHSSVCYSRKFTYLQYPLDGKLAADYGLWLSIFRAGGRFTSLESLQSVYYGRSSVRVSVPSLPPIEEFQRCAVAIFSSRTLSNGGPWCQRFERAIADYVGVSDAISAPSGDAALFMAFCALKIFRPEKREVILPSYTFPSTANAIRWNGFDLVFCDIDPDTLCLAPEIVEPLITENTAAIVPVHSHGNPCDMPGLEHLAAERQVSLISDAAPAFGAMIGNRKIGGFGDMEVFSFSGTKVLAVGEGGMVCCRNPELVTILRRSGRYGISSDYIAEMPGINGKLAEFPSALGCIQLPLFSQWQEQRKKALEFYISLLTDIVKFQNLTCASAKSAWKDLALILPNPRVARQIATRLKSYRIESRPYYKPLHSMPSFSSYRHGPLSTTERLADCIVCVPFYTEIRDEVISLVTEIIKETLK